MLSEPHFPRPPEATRLWAAAALECRRDLGPMLGAEWTTLERRRDLGAMLGAEWTTWPALVCRRHLGAGLGAVPVTLPPRHVTSPFSLPARPFPRRSPRPRSVPPAA